jgi:hypothetical protein
MQYLINIVLALSLMGCIVNVIQTDTHSVASDVVDDTTKTFSSIDPEIRYSR